MGGNQYQPAPADDILVEKIGAYPTSPVRRRHYWLQITVLIVEQGGQPAVLCSIPPNAVWLLTTPDSAN